MENMRIRHVEPSDYSTIIAEVNEWWGGRDMADMLPKLFFIHFRQTSFVAECDGKIVGFLVGFVSQSCADEAYIHFAGVHPAFRKNGIGEALYGKFGDAVRLLGRSIIRCVTSPNNTGSVSFHLRLGFATVPNESDIARVPVVENYDGRGGDRVLFHKILDA